MIHFAVEFRNKALDPNCWNSQKDLAKTLFSLLLLCSDSFQTKWTKITTFLCHEILCDGHSEGADGDQSLCLVICEPSADN